MIDRFCSLRTVWYDTRRYGYNVRTKKVDGQAAWDSIKQILAKFDNPTTPEIQIQIQWKLDTITRYSELSKGGDMKVPEKKDVPQERHDQWEVEHFFLQHFKIPRQHKASLTRLMQIAYNAGQLEAERESKHYPEEAKQYYTDHQLIQFSSYISEQVAERVCEIICSNPPACKELEQLYELFNKEEHVQ